MPMPTRKKSEAKRSRSYHLIYFTPALVWGIFISYFSLLPGNEVPPFMEYFNDKVIHSSIYFLSASLIYLGFIRFNFRNPVSLGMLVFILVLCISYGGAIEVLQYYFIPRRTGDWFDFMANSTGAIVSVLLLVSVHHRLKA